MNVVYFDEKNSCQECVIVSVKPNIIRTYTHQNTHRLNSNILNDQVGHWREHLLPFSLAQCCGVTFIVFALQGFNNSSITWHELILTRRSKVDCKKRKLFLLREGSFEKLTKIDRDRETYQTQQTQHRDLPMANMNKRFARKCVLTPNTTWVLYNNLFTWSKSFDWENVCQRKIILCCQPMAGCMYCIFRRRTSCVVGCF